MSPSPSIQPAEDADHAAPSAPPTTRDATEVTNTEDTTCLQSCLRFFSTFFGATGTIPIVIASTLVAFGLGSVVGIVPDVVADRYARIRYDYTGADCTTFDRLDKPDACQAGADDAQAAAAGATLALNILTLIFNPVVGSISDLRGRRGVILISLLLYSLGPAVFILLQLVPWLSPSVYYVAVSLSRAVDFMSMSFAAVSDVLPEEIRAAGYGILLAGFYCGFSLAPTLPLFMSHFQVSLFSCLSLLLAFFVALVALPETLPESVAEENLHALQQQQHGDEILRSNRGSNHSGEDDSTSFLHTVEENVQHLSDTKWTVELAKTVTRPIRDMAILTRGSLPILAAASFFSAMVYSSDKTFVIYYIEDQLNVRDADLAKMFLIFGPVGVIIQAFFIQPLLRIFGEKHLLIIAFLSGTCHNALYGFARSKSTILVALCLSQLTKVNFPILSSYASRGASANEQGRVQGALFALNALANAAGPMLLEIVYDRTKNGHNFLGPGAMFLVASSLYFVGTILVSFLPEVETTSTTDNQNGTEETICDTEEEARISLQEPLLVASDESSQIT